MARSEERRERGVAAIEYVVMVLLIVFGMLAALGPVGAAINAMFVRVAGAFP